MGAVKTVDELTTRFRDQGLRVTPQRQAIFRLLHGVDTHPTVEALYAPDIDESLDEQPAKTAFWNAFKPLGQWWAELPPY